MKFSRRVRIVYLIDSLGMGGAERLLVNTLQHLDTKRFEPRVCALDVRDGNPVASVIQKMNIPVDLVSIPHLRDLAGLLRLIKYLRNQKTDLLHVQLEFANTFGSFAGRKVGIPTVSTQHTFDNPPKFTREYWRHRLMWCSLRHCCDIIVSVSNAGRRHNIRVGKLMPDKVITIYGGIDLDPFNKHNQSLRLDLRQEFGVPLNAPLLITVAVLRREKGIQYLIEALPAILEAVPETRYLVVGDGKHLSALRDLAKTMGVAERVIFTGMRSDIPDLLAISDLFVLPTLKDVLPTVLSEAMASQKPIVASNVGGVPEMVEDGQNGLLVSPANPMKLAEACIHLLHDPARIRAMGDTGREFVDQRFNVRKQVETLSNLYQNLLTNHKR